MEGGKKRKRSEDSPEPLTITYDAPNRTFQRLFKEDSLEAMRDVVRKKLGVSSGTPVNLSRIHDGASIDLEDDDDFEAFSTNARSFSVVKVKVTLGDGLPNGNSAVDAPTRKKSKKQKKPDIAADSPGSDERPISPRHKKRRVSFVDPSAERQEDTLSLSAEPFNGNAISAQPQNSEPVVVTAQLSANGDLSEKKRRRKKKKDKTGTDDNISAAQVGSIDEPLSAKKLKKKRRREDAGSIVAGAGVDVPQPSSSLPGDNDSDERPAKKSKKKHSETARDDNHTSKSPPSRSPSPKAFDQVDEAEVTSHKVKKAKKNQNATTSGISSVEQPLQQPVGAANQQEEPTIPAKKKKEKSKPLDAERRAQSKEPAVPSSSSVITQAEKEKLAKLAKNRQQEKATKALVQKALDSEESEQSEEEDDEEPNTRETKRKGEKAVTNGGDPRSGKSSEASTKSHETEDHDKLKEAAKQSLGAILARKNHEHSDPVEPPPQDAPSPTESAHSENESLLQPTTSTKPAAPESTVEKEPPLPEPSSVPPKQAKKTKAPPPPACPYCDATPFHVKTKCPVINSIVLMRNRLEELRAEVGDGEEKKEQRSMAITELETKLEKRTHRKPKASTGGAAESTKEKGTKKPKEQRDGGAESADKNDKSAGKRKGRGKLSPEVVDDDEEEEEEEEGSKEDEEADKDLDDEEGIAKQAQSKANVNGKAKPKEKGKEKEKPKPKASAKGKGAKQKELTPDEDSQDEDTSDSEANEPQKQVDVVASTVAHVVDVQTRTSTSPPPPTSPSPSLPESRPAPSTQPPSTRSQPVTSTPRPSTQPSSSKQPTSLLQTLVQKKVQSTQPPSQELIGLSDDFSMLGDLSQFTDKDAEALLFPKMSIDDVLSSDEDEDEEKDDQVAEDQLLDDDEEEVRVKKPKSGQRYTPSTSDEEEDEDEAAPVNKSPSRSPSFERLIVVDDEQPNSLTQTSSGPRHEQAADLSFKEVDTRGSSREVDKSGNNAVEEAISNDLGPAGLAATINKAMEADSDTAVASNNEDVGTGPMSVKASSKKKQNKKAGADPIEPPDDGGHRAASVDPIVSDDASIRVMPRNRVEVVIQVPTKNSKPPRPPKVQQDEGGDDNGGRKTRSKKPLSELPIPSARIIVASSSTTDTPTPKTTRGRKAAAAKAKESAKVTTEDTNAAGHESDDVPQTQTRTRSAKASKATPKTPAKPASKIGVTPGTKPSSKSAAASASTTTKTPAKRAPKPPSTTSTKKAAAVKVAPRIPEITEEPESESDSNVPRSQWTILQDEGSSSKLLETPGQFDELASSPHSLFIHSETQPRFSYSQKFPDTPGSQPTDAAQAHADDSDDEDENEVEKSVLKPSTSSSQSRYRGLSAFQSGSQSFATPKFVANPTNKEAEQDLYGREEADKSSSSSSSDSDENPPPRKSHIEASRRAGLKASKK